MGPVYEAWADAADLVIHHSEWGKQRALATYRVRRSRHAMWSSPMDTSRSGSRRRADPEVESERRSESSGFDPAFCASVSSARRERRRMSNWPCGRSPVVGATTSNCWSCHFAMTTTCPTIRASWPGRTRWSRGRSTSGGWPRWTRSLMPFDPDGRDAHHRHDRRRHRLRAADHRFVVAVPPRDAGRRRDHLRRHRAGPHRGASTASINAALDAAAKAALRPPPGPRLVDDRRTDLRRARPARQQPTLNECECAA